MPRIPGLSPVERMWLPARLVRFALAVAVCSLPLWFAYAVARGTVGIKTAGPRSVVWLGSLLLAGCGIAFTPVGALGIRYLGWRRRLGPVRHTLALAWVLITAILWWTIAHFLLSVMGLAQVVANYGALAQAWVSIVIAGSIFYASYAARGTVAPRLPVDPVPRWRRKAFELYPKALSVRNPGDVFEIVEGLDDVERAYGTSLEEGARALKLFQHHLRVTSDPRYRRPMPLPVAVEFLLREIEARSEARTCRVSTQVDKMDSIASNVLVEPAVLHAAGAFVVEYGQQRREDDIALHVGFRHSPSPCIQIETNIRGADLRFVVPPNSRAQGAKALLVSALNEFASGEALFESTQDSHGNLVLRVFARSHDTADGNWEDVERRLGEDTRLLGTCTLSSGSNRVYSTEDRVHKVQLVDRASPKALTLAEEYSVLRRLQGIEGVPQSTEYTEHPSFAVLSYDRIHGQPISEYLAERNFDRSAWFRCISDLSSLLSRIHQRGVIHRDLRPDNILIGEDGRAALVDFDQAVAGAYDARQVDLTGEQHGDITPCISVPQLVNMLDLDQEYQACTHQLSRAWRRAARSDASSPGVDVAYYRWLFGHVELPGERDWCGRWDLVYGALRPILRGARVLDLGCNLGLMATHCMLYGAQRVVAVDIYDDILDAARMVAEAAAVSVDFCKGDLNSPGFVTSLLEQEFDIVLALSVTHWIEDRNQASHILQAAPTLLYEGHGPASMEADHLRQLDFAGVQLIGYSERLRALYLASRDAPGV
ncbi:MAG: methyltransferase domain-containing protein [Anaerolineae bacterium]|nr:methyltransferase domain-containing protein [Anaerolineae bacterium]